MENSSNDPVVLDKKSESSVNEVWKLVAEEGRSARNLLAWNVPIDTTGAAGEMKMKSSQLSPKSSVIKISDRDESCRNKQENRIKARIRSASAGRNPKLDLRARYWAFLFENLRRAVDELYNTCEGNENIAECKEVIMILENFTKDFSALIEWIKLKNEYENTPPPNRPLSLAWEVRKTSPVKIQPYEFRSSMGEKVVRRLDFETVSNGNASEAAKFEVSSAIKKFSFSAKSHHSCDDASKPLKKCDIKSANESLKSSPVAKSNVTKYVHHSSKLDQTSHLFESTSGKVEIHSKDNNKPIISTYHASQSTSLNESNLNGGKQNDNPRSDSLSSLSSTSSSSKSWADKVKGSPSTVLLVPSEEDDSGGWETVQRNKLKARNSSYSKQINCNKQWRSEMRTNRSISSVDQKDISRSQSDEKLNSSTVSNRERKKEITGKTVSNGVFRDNINCKRSCSYPDIQEIKTQLQVRKKKQQDRNPSFKKGVKSTKVYDGATKTDKAINCSEKKSLTGANRMQPNKHYKNVTNELKIKRKLLETAVAISETEAAGDERVFQNVMQNSNHLREDKIKNVLRVPSLKELVQLTIDKMPSHKERYLKCCSGVCGDRRKNDLSLNTEKDQDYISEAFDDALKSAIQEEKILTKQLEDSQKCESSAPPSEIEGKESPEVSNSSPTDWHLIHEETEERLAHHLANMTWGDRMDRIEAELRLPGRALHMHEKLSSPSRKRSLSESIRRHEEKQAKAQEQRERILEEKAQKFREVSKKVEEVRVWKEELLNHRRIMMEHKLQKAEEKRRLQLQMIIKKAHDEEEKVNEIAFINTLEAQNKRHDVLTRIQGFEARLLDIQEERQRRQEEKAAKEAAAEERRRALEAERQARLIEIQEKRKLKEHKIEQQQQEKEKERIEQAREKARDREERLSALHAAQQATVEELQKKIQQKQEESARRHEENIEHIRQKALELSILRYSSTNDDAPKLVPYEKKKICSLCNVLIDSEVYLLSHLRGKKHQQAVKDKHEGNEPSREELEMYNLQHIYDAPADKLDPHLALEKERQKILKKRCKKLKQRMVARGSEYEQSVQRSAGEISFKGRMVKGLKEIGKYNQQLNTDSLPNNFATILDRALNEIAKHLEKQDATDLNLFLLHNGFSVVGQLLIKLMAVYQKGISLPKKCFSTACNVYYLACANSYENCCFVISSNRVGELVEIFIQQLSNLVAAGTLPPSPCTALAGAVAKALATIFASLVERETGDGQPSLERIQDVISYIVSVGIVDKLSAYFNNTRGVIDNESHVCDLMMWSCRLVGSLAQLTTHKKDPFGGRDPGSTEDPTELVAALRATDLVGTMPLLYGVLLHSGAPARGESPPPLLSVHTLSVITSALRMLNYIALLDLHLFQGVLGNEGLSLEFRHIASYLLWFCSLRPSHQDLLHELLLSIGYFAVLNTDNQVMIHSGHAPTVLHQLCSLPFHYFSRPHLTRVLFPTLIACCFDNQQNKAIVEQEMSCQLMLDYLQQEETAEGAPREEHVTHGTTDEGVKRGSLDRWRLPLRFPNSKWTEAARFFAQPSRPSCPSLSEETTENCPS